MNDPLTPHQLSSLEESLRRQVETLESELKSERAEVESARDSSSSAEVRDSTDASIAGSMRDVNRAVLDHHRLEIREVRAALSRMDDGTYGQCLDCADPIGYLRLKAYPMASRCVKCQAKQEMGHG